MPKLLFDQNLIGTSRRAWSAASLVAIIGGVVGLYLSGGVH